MDATTPKGLTSSEAEALLARWGPNQSASRHKSPLAQLLPLLGNPLALVLLVASALSAVLGDVVDASLIAGMVIFSVTINLFQTWRSQKAADKLRQQVAPTATVRRDGRWVELPRGEVVPGDVIRLTAGDLVPADARLLEARDVHMHEAALTGESLPAEKQVTRAADDPAGTVWLGTSVVSGIATALVTATGSSTSFGDVIARLSTRAPETEFDRGLRHFGLLITRTVMVLVLILLAASLAMHRPAFESLLFAVALAVGLTPEFLPMITTVTLAQGASRMAAQHVIVKNLAAIQNLGSIDVLCSDKTGTLTVGEMSVEASCDARGETIPGRWLSPASTAASRPASAARSTPPSSPPRRTKTPGGPSSTRSRSTSSGAACRSWRSVAAIGGSSPRAHPTGSAPCARARRRSASGGARGLPGQGSAGCASWPWPRGVSTGSPPGRRPTSGT